MKKQGEMILWIPAVVLGGCYTWLAYLAAGQTLFFSWRRTGLLLLALPLLSAIIFFILRLVIRPAAAGIKPAAKLAAVVFCLLAGGYLLTFSPWDLPMPIGMQSLNITHLAQKNPDALGARSELLSFTSDGDFISYNTFSDAYNWTRDDTRLFSEASVPSVAIWHGRAKNIALSFRVSPESGKILLDWNGQTAVHDLYNLEIDQQTFIFEAVVSPVDRALTLVVYSLSAGFILLVLSAIFVLIWRQTPPLAQPKDALPPLRSRFWLLPIAGFILGAGLLLFSVRSSGVIISTDTVNYVSAARHLLAGEGYIAENNDVYDWWPPLYPNYLAVLSAVPGVNTLDLITLGNAVLYGLLVALSVVLARAALPRARLAAPIMLLLGIVSRPYLNCARSMLSDTLFILFVLLFFIFLFQYFHTKKWAYTVGFTLAAASVFLTRYIGEMLIISGFLTLLFFLPGSRIWRLLQAAAFGVGSAAPTLLWMGRSYILTGLLTGLRTPAEVTAAENIQRVIRTLQSWLVPTGLEAIGTILLVAGLILSLIWLRKNKSFQTDQMPIWFAITSYLVFYTSGLIITLSLYSNTPIGDRLLAPVFPGLALVLTAWIHAIGTQSPRWLFRTTASLILAFLLVQPVLNYYNTQGSIPAMNQGSIPINSMKNNSIIRFLEQHPSLHDTRVYSNCHRCVYIFANQHPTRLFDEDHLDLDFTNVESVYLIWFADVAPWFNRPVPGNTLPDLASAAGRPVTLNLLFSSTDGQIIEIR